MVVALLGAIVLAGVATLVRQRMEGDGLTPTDIAVRLALSDSQAGSDYDVYRVARVASTLAPRVASTLAPTRRELALQVLDHALETAKRLEDAEDRAQAQVAIAERLARLGQRSKALALLAEATRTGTRGPYDALRVYHALGDIDNALRAIERMGKSQEGKEEEVDYDDFCRARQLAFIAMDYLDADRRPEAMGILTRAQALSASFALRDHWHAMGLQSVSQAYAKAGDMRRALAVAHEIPSTLFDLLDAGEQRFSPVRFKIIALVTIVQKHLEAERMAEAKEVLDTAGTLAEGIAHRHLRAEMVMAVAATYAGAAKFCGDDIYPCDENPPPVHMPTGIAMARAMRHPLLKGMALRWIADRLSADGKQQEAIPLLDEALATLQGIPDDSDDACVSELGFFDKRKGYVLGDLAEAYARAGAVTKGLHVAESINDDKYDWANALTGIARACLKQGSREQAVAILDQVHAREEGTKRTALAFAEAALPNRAVAVARGCSDHDIEDIVVAHVEAERYELAMETAAVIEDMSYVRQALAEIGKEFPSDAHPMTDRARRALDQIARRFLVAP
jgi:tetratricopeptide (TPR) repeat protein